MPTSGVRNVILFMGDSLMQRQFEHSHHLFSMPVSLIQTHGGGRPPHVRFPSNCAPEFATLLRRVRDGTHRVLLAYVNFAAIHSLHLHPVRPWWYVHNRSSCSEVTDKSAAVNEVGMWWGRRYLRPNSDVADLRLWASFESLVHEQLAALRKIAAQVVVMTPWTICESVYYGDYAALTAGSRRAESIEGCERFIRHQARHAAWPLPAAASNESLRDWCRTATLTSNGSAAISARLRRAVSREATSKEAHRAEVRIVDGEALTRGRCDQTRDGRHYSLSIINRTLDELVGLVRNRSLLRKPDAEGQDPRPRVPEIVRAPGATVISRRNFGS